MEKRFSNTGFNNGTFCNVSEITVPIDNLAVGRAYAAYEFFRVHNTIPFYLDRHLDRFFKSLEYLKFGINYSRNEVIDIINQLITKNQIPDFYFKLYAIPQNTINHSVPACFYIIPVEILPYNKELYLNGTSLLMKEYKRFLPEAKSTNYIASVFWQSEMEAMNAIDVLFVQNNQVFESSRGNIFIVKKETIYTPDNHILKGITRSIVIDLIKESSFHLSVQPVFIDEINNADEVFLTSTVKMIMPIVKINNKIIGNRKPGIVTNKISEMYKLLLTK